MSYRMRMMSLTAALLVGGAAVTAGPAVAGLSAYYALDEGTGSTAHDGTPNGNDGTISGATWTTGNPGSALYFHGGGQWVNGDCVTVPHAASLDITGPFEVEAWIKASGSDPYNAIVDKYSYSGGFGYGLTFYLNDGRLRLSIYSGPDGGGNVSGTTDLRDNAWHHVSGVWDGSHAAVYVGGTPEAASPWSHPPASTTSDLGIGKRLGGHGGYLPFLGTIDEVYIYQNQPPDCCFEYAPPDPDDQTPVEFIDCSTDPDGDSVISWSWDFADGGTSIEQNPTHSFAAGTWEVCLTVTDDGRPPLSATCCGTITVTQGNLPPECCFSYDPAIPDHLTPVQFTDCSADPDGAVVAWEWDFGDGCISADQNPSHQFAPGNWEVALTVTDDGGASATCTATVHVEPAGPPVPDLLEPIDPAWVDRRPPLTGLVALNCTEATGRTSVLDPNGNGDIVSVAFDYSPDDGMTWVPIEVDYDGTTPTDGGPNPSGPHYNWWSAEWDVSESPFPEGMYTIRATMEDSQGQSGQSSTQAFANPGTGPYQIAQPAEYATFPEGSTINLALVGATLAADWYWQPKQDIYQKGVPLLNQFQVGYYTNCPKHGTRCPHKPPSLANYFCAPTAWASCFKWWDANGFPGLVPTGMTDQQFVEALAVAMNTDCESGTSAADQVQGARDWISARGVALHVTYYFQAWLDANRWCKTFRNEIENCKEDVLLSYDTLLGGRHRSTGNGFDNAWGVTDFACIIEVMDPGYGSYRPAWMKPSGWISFDSGTNWTKTRDIITASPDTPLQPWYLACPKTMLVPQSWNLNNSATWQDPNTPMRGDSYYLLRADSSSGPAINPTLYSDTIVIEITNVMPTCDIVFSPRDASDGKVWTRYPVDFYSNAWDAGNPGQKGLTCQWNFGDGITGSGCNIKHVYMTPGTYQVTLTVTDDEGDTCTDVQGVTAKGFKLPVPGPLQPRWNLITLPCIHSDPWEVFDELRPPNKPMDLLSGNLHRYDHEEQRYVTYYEWAPSDFGPLQAGEGYWLYVFGEENITYEGECSGMEEQVQFTTPGWYMIGSPQPFDIFVDNTLWYEGLAGPAPFGEIMNTWVQDPLVYYTPDPAGYLGMGLLPTDDDDHFRAFKGYWMYAFTPDLMVTVPPPPP